MNKLGVYYIGIGKLCKHVQTTMFMTHDFTLATCCYMEKCWFTQQKTRESGGDQV